MATNDLEVMEDFLTIVDREMMTSLDRMRQSRRNFDPIFKQTFLQTVNHRVALTYSKFEMKLQMEPSSSGLGNGEAMSTSRQIKPDLGFAGKWNNRLDDFGTRDSNKIKTILQLVDSSDGEDVKVVLKKEVEEPANQNEHRESDQQVENAESNRMAVLTGGDEVAPIHHNHLMQNGDALTIDSMVDTISHMKDQITSQSISVTDEGIHYNNDPSVNAASKTSAERTRQCQQAMSSIGIKAIKKTTDDKRKCHKCQICQFVSCYKRSLIRHMRTHTGERPHQCDKCLKSFSQSLNLNQHQLMHIKQYKVSADLIQKARK